jgi:alkylhydroperoxidase/carboxymuconolactone decarboxylase family protein YurZ
MKKKLEIFDPPMCCSTGVCGPSVDPHLAQFAADLEWLTDQGVSVQRFGLTQQPEEYAGNELVRQALTESGQDCLPIILADGDIVSRGAYPQREELARIAGFETSAPMSMYNSAVAHMVAVGAAIGANCEPCLQYHFGKAVECGATLADLDRAIKMAHAVKDKPAQNIFAAAQELLAGESTEDCCQGESESECC